MFKKFKNIRRKIKNDINLYIFFIIIELLEALFTIFLLIFFGLLYGLIVSTCWNIAICSMFNVGRITIFQGFILIFTIHCMKFDYISFAKSEYKIFKKYVFNNDSNISKIMCILLVILLEIFSISITIFIVLYSWNNILPQLLHIELIKINKVQAFCFTYLINLIFRVPHSNNKE